MRKTEAAALQRKAVHERVETSFTANTYPKKAHSGDTNGNGTQRQM